MVVSSEVQGWKDTGWSGIWGKRAGAMEKFFIFIWAVSTQESYIKLQGYMYFGCTKYTY